MAAEPKATIRQYAEEVWNQGNLAAVDTYIAPDYRRHDPGIPMEVRSPEGIKQLVMMYRTAFPDIHFTAEDQSRKGTW